jgi:hypothetical protein
MASPLLTGLERLFKGVGGADRREQGMIDEATDSSSSSLLYMW